MLRCASLSSKRVFSGNRFASLLLQNVFVLLEEFVPEFDRLGVRILVSDEAVVRDVDAVYDAVFDRLERSFASDQIAEREREIFV